MVSRGTECFETLLFVSNKYFPIFYFKPNYNQEYQEQSLKLYIYIYIYIYI